MLELAQKQSGDSIRNEPSNTRLEGSSVFDFTGNVTLVAYVPSMGKAVLALSAMHHDASTAGDAQKP